MPLMMRSLLPPAHPTTGVGPSTAATNAFTGTGS